MALIKCPECNHNISDKCEVCPKCGYEVVKKSDNAENHINKNNNNTKYFIIIAIIVVGLLIYGGSRKTSENNNQNSNQNNNQNNNQNYNQNNDSNNNGNSVYTSKSLGISFSYPNTYKVVEQSGEIYVAQTVDNRGALIPYVVITKYDGYNNAVQLLNKFTDAMRNEYSDIRITIDLTSGNIGGKLVYGLAYNYTSSGHLVVDNRYAFVLNNKVYMVGTKEENQNSQEINNTASSIIESFTEGGM